MFYVLPIDSPCDYICSYHIPCPCKHYTVLFLSSSFITRGCVGISNKGRETLCIVLDSDRIRGLKERINREGEDVDDLDLVYRGKQLGDDQQWWQTGRFAKIDYPYIHLYKR